MGSEAYYKLLVVRKLRELQKKMAHKRAVEACGIAENDGVVYLGSDHVFLGVTAQGTMKIRPVSGGRIVCASPLSVRYQGKPIQVFSRQN